MVLVEAILLFEEFSSLASSAARSSGVIKASIISRRRFRDLACTVLDEEDIESAELGL